MENKNKQLINSLSRGLIILEKILDEGPVGITEMGKYLGINKSSAYRLLSTLESRGYVEQDPVTSRYKLGMIFLRFSEKILDNLTIRDVAKPFLKEIVNRTKETAHLSVLFQSQAVFIDQEKSPEIVSVSTKIGMSEPLHCSALGKALVSFLPAIEQERILNTLGLEAYTPKTITSLDALRHELRKISEKGYAIDDEEINTGVRCIASPIFNHRGEVVASVGISGPISRVRIDNLNEYVNVVIEIAGRISQKLGYKKI